MEKKQFQKAVYLPHLILCFVIIIVYIPTFSGQFILDDHPLVNENPFVKKRQPFISYFLQEDGILAHDRVEDYHSGYYRPLINISYFFDYKIWGMEASGFRISNLIFHLITCLLLFHVLSKYFTNSISVFFAVLLFGVHPVNTEAVSWISSRNNILVSLFALLSFHFYSLEIEKRKAMCNFLSLLFFVLALLSKEFAVMLLPILFLSNRFKIVKAQTVSKEFMGYIPYSFILALYFWLRWAVTQSALSPSLSENILQRLIFSPYLILYNLKLIFFPYGLHSIIIGYPKTVIGWQLLAGFTGIVIIAWVLWQYRTKKIILFSVFSFLLSLFPILNIIPTSAVSLISMRWLYFPQMFLVFFYSFAITRLLQWRKVPFKIILSAIIISLASYAYWLNHFFWHDEWSFFHKEVIDRNNLIYAGGLAEMYYDRKDFHTAEKNYRLAIQYAPHKARNYLNYSAMLLDIKKPNEALIYLDKARSLKMSPKMKGQLYNNQGMAYFQMGKLDEAVQLFNRAIKYSPNEPGFWANLGGAYGSAGNYQEAVRVLKSGLDISPDSVEMLRNLSITYNRMGEYEKTISLLDNIPSEIMSQSRLDQVLNKAKEGLKSNVRNNPTEK